MLPQIRGTRTRKSAIRIPEDPEDDYSFGTEVSRSSIAFRCVASSISYAKKSLRDRQTLDMLCEVAHAYLADWDPCVKLCHDEDIRRAWVQLFLDHVLPPFPIIYINPFEEDALDNAIHKGGTCERPGDIANQNICLNAVARSKLESELSRKIIT